MSKVGLPIRKYRSRNWPYEVHYRQRALPEVKAGWELKRIKGSHHIFGKAGEWKLITVPVHGKKTIKPGLATRIARDTGISW